MSDDDMPDLGAPELPDDGPQDLTPLLLRRLSWDSLPCEKVDEYLPKLGLTLSAPDMADMEHKDSHLRLARLVPLADTIEAYAAVMGTIVTEVMLSRASDGKRESLTEEQQQSFAEQNVGLIETTARVIIANMLDTDQLQYGRSIPVVVIQNG